MGDICYDHSSSCSNLSCFQLSLSFILCSLEHLVFDFCLNLFRLLHLSLNLSIESFTLIQKLRAVVIQEVFLVQSLCVPDLDAV